jgi:hypothetical protein
MGWLKENSYYLTALCDMSSKGMCKRQVVSGPAAPVPGLILSPAPRRERFSNLQIIIVM